jgi:hypothetical protein
MELKARQRGLTCTSRPPIETMLQSAPSLIGVVRSIAVSRSWNVPATSAVPREPTWAYITASVEKGQNRKFFDGSRAGSGRQVPRCKLMSDVLISQ